MQHQLNHRRLAMINRDRISALLFLILSLIYGYHSSKIPSFPGDDYEPFTAKTLPSILSYIGICLSLILLISPTKNFEKYCFKNFDYLRLIGLLALMTLYALGLSYLGFALATGLFLLCGFYLLGERNIKLLLGVSFPFAILFYLLLTKLLDIYLEPGLIYISWHN